MKKLKENIYYTGVLNPTLRVFDIIMTTEFGTTYNSYLIKGDKTALVETVHNDYFEQMKENIEQVCKINEIDYIILNHTEPDHSGSVAKMLAINPDITIVGSAVAIKYVKSICNMEFKSIAVKTGDSLDLGQGIVCEFITAPNLHWPDSIFTYVPSRKTVFTCDFLGSHYCEPMITNDYILHKDCYDKAFSYYYTAIFGPFKKFVLDGLKKLEGLDIEMVCCSHGPVLKEGIQDCMDKYNKWSLPVEKEKNIAVFYVSAYGYTEMIADCFVKKFNELGVKAQKYDIIKNDLCDLKEKLENASGILFGSPTINKDAVKPVWDLLSVTDAIVNRGKPYIAFGSYGWSGEACKMIESRADGLGLKHVCDSLKVVFKPDDNDIAKINELAENFIQNL